MVQTEGKGMGFSNHLDKMLDTLVANATRRATAVPSTIQGVSAGLG